jgi:hypothetical protein
MSDDGRRRLERVALLRRAERDRAAATLERSIAALAVARDAHARAQRALELAGASDDVEPGPLRTDALRAWVTRRDEVREGRRELERAVAAAASALDAARSDRERAGRALAEAESRMSAAHERAEEEKRRRDLAREERADEEAIERRER